MNKYKDLKNKNLTKIVLMLVAIVIVAIFLELLILNGVNDKNINNTEQVLLNQIISIIEKNEKSEDELLKSLKDDYMVRAKAVSYIIDKNPEVEYNTEELEKIASYMSIDEIHLFDETGKIYSGTVPKYYGSSFDSGEQMAYFKPMLKDKSLTMCQDVTPNTSESKKMMYAITWNEKGDKMIQVGIEPVRLLRVVKQNEISAVVRNMPMYEGIGIYVADNKTSKIYGATDETKIGRNLRDIGISESDIKEDNVNSFVKIIGSERYDCVFKKTENYIIGITFATSSNMKSVFLAMFVEAVYLTFAVGGIIFMLIRLFRVNKERREQYNILLSMAEIYYSMHLFDLEKNTMLVYEAHNEVEEIGKRGKYVDEMMREAMERTVLPEYRESAFKFTDLHTVADRMIGKKIISGEFVGKNLGWFRASFITIEKDKNNRPTKVIFTTQSIEKEKQREEKLIYKSNTDELTGCLNRRAYEEDINDIIYEKNFAYVSMDVNGLKTVNDTLGHLAGDELIKGAAQCMKKCFEKYGKVYRIGGDEFVAIVFAEDKKLEEIGEEFKETVSKWKGEKIESLTISCGYVLKSEKNWNSINEMVKAADERMYENKFEHYRKTGIDRRGQQVMYNEICKLYTKILKINLTNDSYQILKMDNEEKDEKLGFSDYISKWLYNFAKAGLVYDDDVKGYLEKTDIEYLRNYFKGNENSISVFYRRKIEGDYKQVMMEIIKADDYEENSQSCFLYVKNIDR